MPRVVVQRLWQQKHPTPTHAGWEFHFHPDRLPPHITGAVSALDVGLAAGPLSAWMISPEALIWIRSFTAVVPSEQRRYTGLAGAVATPAPGHEKRWGEALPGALIELGRTLPAAAPFAGDSAEPRTVDVAPLSVAPPEDWTPFTPSMESARGLAHGLCLGGPVVAPEPLHDRLPILFGRLLSWLPPSFRAVARRGSFVERGAARAATAQPAARNLLHYLARAWIPPADLASRAEFPRVVWRLVADAAATGASVVDLFDELTEMAEVWDAGEDLRRYLLRRAVTEEEVAACDSAAPAPLFSTDVAPGNAGGDAGVLWNRLLHYWGRGFLRRPGDEDGLLRRLAAILAYRILVDHLFHLDAPHDPELPRRYLRRLQYEALLPADRVTAVLSAVGRIMPSLFEKAAAGASERSNK